MPYMRAPRRSRFRGLGMDYNQLLAQAGLQDCDPRDSACVSNNVAKQAAVEDLWVNKYMTQPGGAPDGTVLNFTPQTQAQVTEFYDPTHLAGNVVDTRGILSVQSPAPPVARTNTVYNTPTPTPVQAVANLGTPAPAVVVSSSGAQNAPGASSPAKELAQVIEGLTVAAIPGFDLSSIPWWGWAAGAGALFFAFGGSRGR